MDTGDEKWKLLWGVQRSSRYHARRQAFYDRWRRVTAGIGVIFGSVAATDLLHEGGHAVAVAAAFVVAVTSALDLVVGTADMAWTHRELRRRFLALECAIQRAPEEPTEADVHAWQDERLAIEADEPPIYVALDLLCENEMARADGRPDRVKLPRWATVTAHWLHWENIQAT